jgi:hypothetical protein
VRGGRFGRWLAALGAGALVAAAVAACGHEDPPWTHLSWQAVRLPVPAGDRAMVRGTTWCGDRWIVVGATADEPGHTRPAVWASTDGETWRTLRLDPGNDYYAARAILTSVGCSHGRLAVLGAKSGGAHGNPRTATWAQRADGSLAAVPAAFELYGGPSAVAVSRLVGGASGYLIAGTRATGAAVWTSRTGTSFRLHEGSPGLATTPQRRTQALDAVPVHDGWTVVGDSIDHTGRLTGTVWTGSGAGPWTPTRLPGGGTITTAERMVATDGGPVVVGLDDRGFGVWSERDGRWALDSTFGRVDPTATSAAEISGAAWTGTLLAVTYSDGTRFRLAVGPRDDLDVVPPPRTVTVRGDHAVTVATHADDTLLLTDDGTQGLVWRTHLER